MLLCAWHSKRYNLRVFYSRGFSRPDPQDIAQAVFIILFVLRQPKQFLLLWVSQPPIRNRISLDVHLSTT